MGTIVQRRDARNIGTTARAFYPECLEQGTVTVLGQEEDYTSEGYSVFLTCARSGLEYPGDVSWITVKQVHRYGQGLPP